MKMNVVVVVILNQNQIQMIVNMVHHIKRIGKRFFVSVSFIRKENILENEFHVVQVRNIIKQYYLMVVIISML